MAQTSAGLLTDILNSSSLGQQIFTLISSLLIAGAGAAMWIRAKISKDSVGIKSDLTQVNLLEHLEHERDVLKLDKEKVIDRLMIVESERNQAVSKVSQLTVEVTHLTKQVLHLEGSIASLSEKFDTLTKKMNEMSIENTKYLERLSLWKEMYAIKTDGSILTKAYEPPKEQ